MNNNRGNNRRRGRGNNRQQGGQPLNRIDSRARGNAPQLLEKYRKLAHDAHLNGERVQEEYYLQFADHYFRVIADQKVRQDESRQPRRDDRYADEGDRQNESGQGDDEDTPRDSGRGNERHERSEPEPGDDYAAGQGSDAGSYEPEDNPFLRERHEPKPQRAPRKPRRKAGDEGDSALDGGSGLDPASLPPPIGASSESGAKAAADGDDGEADAKPRRRTRKPRPPASDADETLQTVG